MKARPPQKIPADEIKSSPSIFRQPKLNIKHKFHTAIQFVFATCVTGASNKIEDMKRTNGWVRNTKTHTIRLGKYHKAADHKAEKKRETANYAYSHKLKHLISTDHQWYYQWDKTESFMALCLRMIGDATNPFDHFKTCLPHQKLLISALFSQESRWGNCHNRCCLIAKYLWEHSEGIHRIEIVSAVNFDHYLVIVNRADKSSLAPPKDWGDAWIIDAWCGTHGTFFHATQYKTEMKKIKDYIIYQQRKMAKIGIKVKPVKESKDEYEPLTITENCYKEIRPHVDKYPTFSMKPFYPIEHYYFVNMSVPYFFLDDYIDAAPGLFRPKARIEHEKLFGQCMDELQRVSKNKI